MIDRQLDISMTPETFEKQIQRTHDLIEQPGSMVTWNDHLPDPDNPEQARQIDVIKIGIKFAT